VLLAETGTFICSICRQDGQLNNLGPRSYSRQSSRDDDDDDDDNNSNIGI